MVGRFSHKLFSLWVMRTGSIPIPEQLTWGPWCSDKNSSNTLFVSPKTFLSIFQYLFLSLMLSTALSHSPVLLTWALYIGNPIFKTLELQTDSSSFTYPNPIASLCIGKFQVVSWDSHKEYFLYILFSGT